MTASESFHRGLFNEASYAHPDADLTQVTLRRHGYQGEWSFTARHLGQPGETILQDADVPWTD